MGLPLQIAVRYLGTKSRGGFVSISTGFAILGVTLGVAALLVVMSVTGGFHSEFRKKVLGVNAHVLVLKAAEFHEYRSVMEQVQDVPGVVGVAPFTINPMMVTHGEKTATGVLVKGVDPELMPTVLDLPQYVTRGSLEGLRLPEAAPPTPKTRGGGSIGPTSSPPSLTVGAASVADAGTAPEGLDKDRSLMQALERAIAESEAATRDAGARTPDQEEGADEPTDAGVAGDAWVGSTQPEGGWSSTLPDPLEDLPDEIAPDPCSNPAGGQLPGIVVGATLAANLDLELGDCLQVTSPTIGYSVYGGVIRPPVARQFRVIAVFDAGFDQYDSKLVYVDLYEAQQFFDSGDAVTGVEMKVSDIGAAGSVERQVRARLGSSLYSTMDWMDLNRGLFTALRIQQVIMSAVLGLIIVVAAFTVVATLIMVVLEKRREISVLKAMGATDSAILRVFVYQGGIIGLLGTTAGWVLGLGVCHGLLAYGFPLDPKVYFVSRLPVEVHLLEVFVTGFVALAICLVATLAPALYAAWLRPADGIRAD